MNPTQSSSHTIVICMVDLLLGNVGPQPTGVLMNSRPEPPKAEPPARTRHLPRPGIPDQFPHTDRRQARRRIEPTGIRSRRSRGS